MPLAALGTRLRARLAHPLWVSLGAALAGWLAMQPASWRDLEVKLFDAMVVRSAPNKAELPITIVGIDEASFGALKSGWPLARRHHAKLLDNLGEAGVAVVGFDIAMPDASEREDDDRFAQAIQRFGRVVLASDLAFREDLAVRQWSRVDPYPLFVLAGATSAYAPLQVDHDAVLRRVPTVNDAFWRAVLARFDEAQPGVVESLEAEDDMRIRYLGGPHTFTYVPYHHLLEPARYLPEGWREFLRNNIVLVGRNVNVIEDVGAAPAEMYRTPFFDRTREFMPRVEAHANLIANMVSGATLREAPATWALGLWAASTLAAVLLMRRWHPLRSGGVLALFAAALAGIEYGAFQRWGLWIPAAGAAMTATLVFGANGARAFFSEQSQRRAIRGAFSKYVSPALVDEMIEHPERLRLGGERRQITILFSDLAGFTSIAERLEPENVSAIINRHLSEMTEAILEHSGTVDKFLGDGVMAFWGAPLADPQQAEHAVRAAIEMQRRMGELAAEIPGLGMRIGIHRGECIVGNMGGDNRFDYTAVGDSANLASRLEGANKVYGTRIFASEAVVEACGGAIPFREVDAIRVKGKAIGIRVFTPCEDARLVALSAAALAAYRAGRFADAARAWRELLEMYPQDSVAALFLERLANFDREKAPADWDGVATLTEK